MMQDEQVVAAFVRHGNQLVVEQTNVLLAQGLRGVLPPPGFREQLALALERITGDTELTLSEQVEVATFFLPLTRESAAQAATVPPVLRLRADLSGRTGPVLVVAGVQLGGAVLSSLVLYRNGVLVASGGSPQLTYLDKQPLVQPLIYRAVASYANFADQQQEVAIVLGRQFRYGVGPGDVVPEQVAALATAAVAPTVEVEFSTVEAASLLIFVPDGATLQQIRSVAYGTTNLLATFRARPLVLPDGEAGTLYASYQKQINIADYALQLLFS